ncbi:MAG TPA: hypothetical protein VN041_15995 [Microbacterium sp.]|nr:hypothetical protein [Microbacterium sp.]
MRLLFVFPSIGGTGTAFASGIRPGTPDAKLCSESIFDIEHLSRILRNPSENVADTLEQIFRFPRILGYGFDMDSTPLATDIRTGSPR